MTEETKSSTLSSHGPCLLRIFGVGSGGLMARLARYAVVIPSLLLQCYRVMASRTRIGTRILHRQIGVALWGGGAIVSVEAEIRGDEEMVSEGVDDQDDGQRNQEVAYLLREALPKPFDPVHFLHCSGTPARCQSGLFLRRDESPVTNSRKRKQGLLPLTNTICSNIISL